MGEQQTMPVGLVVVSIQGRDKEQSYVVIRQTKPPFILVADGKKRTVAAPKKKNSRHVKSTGVVAEEIVRQSTSRKEIEDRLLRDVLAKVTNQTGSYDADRGESDCPNRM